jgi:hypothetical protein
MSRYKGVLKHLKTISERTESTDVKGTVFWRDYPLTLMILIGKVKKSHNLSV